MSSTGDGSSKRSSSGSRVPSCTSTCTLDSIGCDNAPPLPLVVRVRECMLCQRPQNSTTGPGWGFVLRGTTSELSEGLKLYTCHIDTVHQNGAAKDAGLKEGDQIVSIDGMEVKHLEHTDVVKAFKSREKVSLVILPARFKSCVQARITRSGVSSLKYIWALMHHLHSLELINVNLQESKTKSGVELNVNGLLSMRSLSINHCSITALDVIKGLSTLAKLESLSLAHNFLTYESLNNKCPLQHLKHLKRLDISRNLLNSLPDVITCALLSLEVLVLVENNISEFPKEFSKLTKLHTLCVDSNLFRQVDGFLQQAPSIQKVTMANNQLEYEPQALKTREFLITSVEDNPYTQPNDKGMVTRNEPSLHRTLSVRGQFVAGKKLKRHSLEWDSLASQNDC